MTEELERVCWHCSYFFTDVNDSRGELGVCIKDETFDVYLDNILEESDFSSCMDLYNEKRFDGDRDVCADYEEIEFIEDEEPEGISQMREEELDRRAESLRTQDVSDIAELLHGGEKERDRAISVLLYLLIYKNKNAFDSVLNFYKSLPRVASIDDVHFRLKILDHLYHYDINEKCSKDLVDMLVGELYKMQSSNTTRQLFSSMLKFLSNSRCESDMVTDQLSWLLINRKFSPKMKQNINSVIREHDQRTAKSAH